jgi:Domain of unknown function (DUF4864)
MKKLFIVGLGICGVLAAGVGLIALAAFAMTRPVVDASEQFLAAIAQKNVAQAYASTSEGFRARISEEDFTSAVNQVALREYASASWRNREIDNSVGLVEGAVIDKKGGVTPISIRLISENNAWKVSGATIDGMDLFAARIPRGGEVERLVSQSLLDFNQAVKSKNFTAFHDSLSERWKKQSTPSSLLKVFQEFIDKKIDIASIKDQRPQINPPQQLTSDNRLQLKGRYQAAPSPIGFELEYANEKGDWKLLSISVRVGGAS